jgi:hypothetical protein
LERYSWSRNSEKRTLEQTAEISWPVFDLETIFAAASDALIGKVRVVSYQFTHSSLGKLLQAEEAAVMTAA